MKKTTWEEVQSEIKALEGQVFEDISEVNETIICAFGDYSYYNEAEVLVSESFSCSHLKKYSAYVNHAKAPMIDFTLYINGGNLTLDDVIV